MEIHVEVPTKTEVPCGPDTTLLNLHPDNSDSPQQGYLHTHGFWGNSQYPAFGLSLKVRQ